MVVPRTLVSLLPVLVDLRVAGISRIVEVRVRVVTAAFEPGEVRVRVTVERRLLLADEVVRVRAASVTVLLRRVAVSRVSETTMGPEEVMTRRMRLGRS